MTTMAIAETVTVVEIRARHDRNRLLGTYDPAGRVLRLFHRGDIVIVKLDDQANHGRSIDINDPLE